MKKLKKIVLPMAATALVFSQTGCKEKETPTDQLTGQWEISDMDGDLEDWFDDDYDVNLEFHMNGDAEFCGIDSPYKYCYLGDWEWNDTEMKEIYMDLDELEITITIDSFDGDEITGEMVLEYDGEKYKGDITMERVYIDKSAMVDKEISVKSEKNSLKY